MTTPLREIQRDLVWPRVDSRASVGAHATCPPTPPLSSFAMRGTCPWVLLLPLPLHLGCTAQAPQGLSHVRPSAHHT
eukprot:6695430-Prymnesium_polylepis.1